MEAIAEHALEPELLLPTPRRLRLPLRTSLLLSVAVLLLGLFVLGSGRALWEGVKLAWLDSAGQTVQGKIDVIQTEPSPSKGQPAGQTAIHYEAAVPGPQGLRLQHGWIALGAPAAAPGIESQAAPLSPGPRFRLGQSFPLRCASFLGATTCQPWGPNPGIRVFSLFLAGGLVMAVSLLLLRRLVRWSGSRGHLLRSGAATIGTITDKRSESEDMMRYFLRYGYASGTSAQGRDREEQVSADQWRAFEVGQPVTVLYDPDNPAHAELYALIVQK
jgi:hypothetical protein